MTQTDAQQLLLEIVEQAQQQKFTQFRLITSWADFKFYRNNAIATKLIIRMLKSSAKNLFKNYCKDIKTGIQDVQQLLAYNEILDIIVFYEKELETFKRMLDEYDDWLGQGHFWYSFLGGERDIWN